MQFYFNPIAKDTKIIAIQERKGRDVVGNTGRVLKVVVVVTDEKELKFDGLSI